MLKSKEGIYPGTFDPITKGHINIVKRSLKFFDKLIIAVAQNEEKNPLFDVNERVNMIKEVFKNNDNIDVIAFDGLLVNLARNLDVKVIIRGLRAVSDFEYELQIALTNRQLCKDFESLFLMPSIEYVYLSSSVVKEIASKNGKLSKFVPDNVKKKLKEKFEK
ncbi:MAG: pantetheine-phosphate adenylyltransferase [Candidatus Mcinerneyibacterium aminivorans]|uniref:Phosphopantetheine adenylyltransferase n=1 Tax=Candidatus Mcinerneyibacterium aminivorans TaxID=2703815 RepID=A0A5D0MB00_9BACT|nr:MAG: pantetheine-phosphate adenylyltransferase [Candidatus Mcinerneyibacterium aminivorans]